MFQLKKNVLIVAAATRFLFKNAEEEVKSSLEQDEDFNKLDDHTKRVIIKLSVHEILEKTIQKFQEEIEQNIFLNNNPS